MFKITLGKGIHMTFANGWTVSIQWGIGNYCDNRWNYGEDYSEAQLRAGAEGSSTAECAVFNPSGDMVKFPGCPDYDDVLGHMNADAVAELIEWVRTR